MSKSIIEKLGITPGPWFVMEDGLGSKPDHPIIYTIDDDLNYIATGANYTSFNKSNNLSNAQLISTAPEMIETLIHTALAFHAETGVEHFSVPVIEKATGRSWKEIKTLLTS